MGICIAMLYTHLRFKRVKILYEVSLQTVFKYNTVKYSLKLTVIYSEHSNKLNLIRDWKTLCKIVGWKSKLLF